MKTILKITAAINDETRLAILRFLEREGQTCVCDICASFNMLQSRISRHLKILKDANLLRSERLGSNVFYELDAPNARPVMEFIAQFDVAAPTLRRE